LWEVIKINKWQAIQRFWEGFEIPAYDQNSVPDDAVAPYITYEAKVADFENALPLSGSIWYRSSSWRDISLKADEIAQSLKQIIKIDGGYMFITRGSPFAQRLNDPNDTVKRIYINLMVEFYTEK
jgi:hypothetical protein